jgi:mono/diheme cytochrome c family protein
MGKRGWYILASLIWLGCMGHYTTAEEKFTLNRSVKAVDHGKNLAFNICGQCHYDRSVKKFIGKPMDDLPGFMGKIYSANLTQSSTYGVLSGYTDSELAYLIKTGIANDGRYVPYMIRPNLADADVNDIILYLRSQSPPVLVADTVAGITRESLLGKMATRISGKPQPYKTGIKKPDENDAVGTGRYLVDNIGCFHCHSKSIITLDYLEPEHSKGYMEGGMKFKGKDGKKVIASNLTFDKETGIGKYSKWELRNALRKGKLSSGRELKAPMKQFPELTDKQVDAIYTYLHTLTPVYNKVK